MPSRTWPFPRGVIGMGLSSSVRIMRRAASTAMYDTASRVKAQPKPTVTTRKPAMAGPKMREQFTSAL